MTEQKSLAKAIDLSLEDWQEWCEMHGMPPFRAQQIVKWLFQKKGFDPMEYSNIPLKERELLAKSFSFDLTTIHSHLISKDGAEKLLLQTDDNLLFEMVIMPYESRVTLCISSQVGCKRGCTFCQTGKMGLMRNLSSGEILAQILVANLLLEKRQLRVTNVVFMGMGEPLDNYDEVVKACRLMIDPHAFDLSKYRVTISTSGVVPEIRKLAKDLPVRLAISLHSPYDEKRSEMMPVNRIYPLSELKKALLEYPAPKRLGITFEYVMIEGVNDHLADARALVKFLDGIKAKVNLIPINHFPGIEMKASTASRLRDFQVYLTKRSIPSPIRYSRAQDISGGCGQLAAKAEHELHLDPRELTKERRKEMRARASKELTSVSS